MLTDVPLQLIDEKAPSTEIFLYIGVKLFNMGPHPVLPPVVELIPRRFLLAFHHLVQQYLAFTTELPSMQSLVETIRRPTIAEELQAINELIGNMETALAEAERQVAVNPSARIVDVLRGGCTTTNVINAVASPVVTSAQTTANGSAVPFSRIPNTSTPAIAVAAVATGVARHEQQIASGSQDIDVPALLTQPPPYRPTPLRASRRLYSMGAVDAHTQALRPIAKYITLDPAALSNLHPSRTPKMNAVGPNKSRTSTKIPATTEAREPAVDVSRRPSTLAVRKCYDPAQTAVLGENFSSTSNSPSDAPVPRRISSKRQAVVAPVRRVAEVVTDLRANEVYSSPARAENDIMSYFPDPSPMGTTDYDPDFLRSVDELLDSLTEDKGTNT